MLRDVVLRNEYAGSYLPSQTWQLGPNTLAVTGGISYYNSGFTNTQPSEIAVSPDGQRLQYAIGNSGSSKTIDRLNGSHQTITMTANCTFTFTSGRINGRDLDFGADSGRYGLPYGDLAVELQESRWLVNSQYGAGAVDEVTMVWDGSNWRETTRALNLG